jgi:hypothetical protein
LSLAQNIGRKLKKRGQWLRSSLNPAILKSDSSLVRSILNDVNRTGKGAKLRPFCQLDSVKSHLDEFQNEAAPPDDTNSICRLCNAPGQRERAGTRVAIQAIETETPNWDLKSATVAARQGYLVTITTIVDSTSP